MSEDGITYTQVAEALDKLVDRDILSEEAATNILMDLILSQDEDPEDEALPEKLV